MAIIQTTSRQFRDNQKDFFDLADKGERVIIRRGKKQAYLLTPVDDDDLYITPLMLDKINRSLKQVKEGKGKEHNRPAALTFGLEYYA